jgi:hypothetical protein
MVLFADRKRWVGNVKSIEKAIEALADFQSGSAREL